MYIQPLSQSRSSAGQGEGIRGKISLGIKAKPANRSSGKINYSVKHSICCHEESDLHPTQALYVPIVQLWVWEHKEQSTEQLLFTSATPPIAQYISPKSCTGCLWTR